MSYDLVALFFPSIVVAFVMATIAALFIKKNTYDSKFVNATFILTVFVISFLVTFLFFTSGFTAL